MIGTVIAIMLIIAKLLSGFGTVKGDVHITHTDKNLWQISYNFQKSVIGIMTGPETHEYHMSSWSLPEGFHMVTDKSGYSWIEKKDKGSFKSLRVTIKTYDRLVPYAPQPFAKFDYGVSINTGPLGFAAKVKLFGLIEMMHNFELKYSFFGIENEYILVPNYENTQDVLIKGQGCFVFFGERDKIDENEIVTLILDSDFPNELGEEIVTTLGKFATLYNQKFGEVFDNKLIVQISYTNKPRIKGEYFGIGGGAQNNQIMGMAFGPVDSMKIEETRKSLMAFLSHEMAHIWVKSLGNDDMRWYNEGNAEILSHIGMMHLGFLSEKDFNIFLNQYLTESINDLAKESLELPHQKGLERLNYSGGSIVLWTICKAIARTNQTNDIYSLNQELHKFSQDSLSRFPKECLSATLASLGMNDDEILAIYYFIKTKHQNPQKAFVDLFELLKVEHEFFGDSLVLLEQE